MNAVAQIAYTLFVGLPLCFFLCTIGFMLCCTIVLIPAGVPCFMLAFKVLTIKLQPPSSYNVQLRQGGQE